MYQQFILPKDGMVYYDTIVERCSNLITCGIWDGINKTSLGKWLNNFKNDLERYFAACILDNVIYRSERQTIALLKHLFERCLPDLNRIKNMPCGLIDDWQSTLSDSIKDPQIRLVPVIKSSDPPTKSAYLIGRLMKRHLMISENWIIKPEEIELNLKKGVNVILFFDDFMGTGYQFDEFIHNYSLITYFPVIYSVYMTLTAHIKGIDYISNVYKDLKIVTVEILDYSHSVFHYECRCFQDGVNNCRTAKNFYYELIKKNNINIKGPNRRGFGHLELTYTFQHASPDNCLPILWWNKSPKKWAPLFMR